MNHTVVVIGSYNSDMVIKTGRLPRSGETVLGGRFSSGPGGKGANQAVAAAQAGASVHLIARVGSDHLGSDALRLLQAKGVDTTFVSRDASSPTGTAWVIVDDRGENSIVVASGANACFSPADVASAESAIAGADMLLMQLEVPVETLQSALELAARHHVRVILNPAPARVLCHDFLEKISIITPNEIEAEMLTGVRIEGERSLALAAHALHAKGIESVIITLGSKGVFVSCPGQEFLMPAFAVPVVDTTAAGDVFNGCLAAFLDASMPLREAVRASTAAAALSVMKLGAQESAPDLAAILAFLREHPMAETISKEM